MALYSHVPSTIRTDDAGLLTPKQVAESVGISTSTLKRLRQRGEGPRAIRVTIRTIRYRKADVEEWLSERASNQHRMRGSAND